MKNELQILPLRLFEVTYVLSVDQNDQMFTEKFTADYHRLEDGRNQFLRTGNVIREYQLPLISIIVTPIDEDA